LANYFNKVLDTTTDLLVIDEEEVDWSVNET
jgi:hypothetical protein